MSEVWRFSHLYSLLLVNSRDFWTWTWLRVSRLSWGRAGKDGHLDKELANRIEHGNSECGQEGSNDGDDNPRVVGDPVPNVVRLHPLFEGQPKASWVLAALLLEDKAVHAVPGHDGIPNQHKVDVGKLGQHLGVWGLGGDVGNLSIAAEQAVQGLL